MSDNTFEKPDPYFWIAVAITIFVCMLAFVGGYQYCLGTEKDKSALIALFIVPFSFQVIGLFILYFRKRKGEDIKSFYWFCLVYMPVCLLSYLFMWVWYALNWNSYWGQGASLILIFVLIIPASGMTYSILESFGEGRNGKDSVQMSQVQSNNASGNLANLWNYGILLKNMKDSASNAPYFALLFFLGMFLAVTFLFSFAFHNRSQLNNTSAGQFSNDSAPALYMPPTPYDIDTEFRDVIGINFTDGRNSQSIINSATLPQYRFYFDIGSAYPKYSNSNGQPGAVGDNRSRETIGSDKKWREEQNRKNLEDLVRNIRESTKKSNRVRIELEGITNSPSTDKRIYISNYELAEVRSQVVKKELLKALSDRRMRNIEWHCVPLPTESLDKTLSDREMEEKRREVDGLFDTFSFNAALSNYRKRLEKPIDDFRKLLIRKSEQKDDIAILIGRLKYVRDIIEKNNADPTEVNEKDINKAIDQFKQEVDHVEHTGIDSTTKADPRRNVVEVYLSELYEQPLCYKFELMDYVIYVIAGADYGDVIPLTSYAKFLSSFAHILQIFFMVALFSAVLTLKKSPLALCKVIPNHIRLAATSSREKSHVFVEAPENFHWKAETKADWISINSPVPLRGSGRFTFYVEENDGVMRSNIIEIAGAVVTVEQDRAEFPGGRNITGKATTIAAEIPIVTVKQVKDEFSSEEDIAVIPIERK